MEHIAAIMMLVGCSQGALDCREVPAPAVGFETTEECQQLLQPALVQTKHRFEVVYGKCAAIDPALYIEDATITWDITPADELDVQVIFDQPTAPVLVAEKAGRAPVIN